MTSNILILHQNTFTISPIIVGGLLFIMIVTGKWKNEKLLIFNLIMNGACLSLVAFGYIKIGMSLMVLALSLSTLYAIFRKRVYN